MLRIHNSRSGRKEELRPIRPGEVGMYVCGDTVYDFCHLGHARMLIAFNTGAYAAIDLSQWIAGNPAYLLADHFGKPPEFFDGLPKQDVFIAPGSPGLTKP